MVNQHRGRRREHVSSHRFGGREQGCAHGATEPPAWTNGPERIHIGTSGWVYREWRGSYYPATVAHRQELEYLAQRLSTVELNGSFYSLQRPSSYRSWRDRTPDEFVFAIKGHRFVTHLRQLRDPHVSVANFLASGVLELRDKLGPVLWQLPETMEFDQHKVGEFLAALPHDHQAAATMVTDHATLIPEDGPTAPGSDRPLRHAIEVRNQTFDTDEFRDLLRANNVALVTADTAGHWPLFDEVTADFAYVRLHGSTELYASKYDEDELESWADKVRNWTEAGDVYVYFDNTAKAAAPHNAQQLMTLVGVPA